MRMGEGVLRWDVVERGCRVSYTPTGSEPISIAQASRSSRDETIHVALKRLIERCRDVGEHQVARDIWELDPCDLW